MSAAPLPKAEAPTTVAVSLGDRSYPILVGRGVIDEAGRRIAATGARAAAVITDDRVGALHADRLRASLDAHGLRTTVATVPPGEES